MKGTVNTSILSKYHARTYLARVQKVAYKEYPIKRHVGPKPSTLEKNVQIQKRLRITFYSILAMFVTATASGPPPEAVRHRFSPDI